MITVYGDAKSGNCYKVQLVLALLNIPHTWQELDILKGDTQSASFLAKNPVGKMPLLELDDGRFLSESNAIIGFLAAKSPLIPEDEYAKAKMYQWLFFEQYSHEPYVAVARFIQLYLGLPAARQEEYQSVQIKGYKALDVMENVLTKQDFMIGSALSLADIALFAYTHVAHEGGFDLSPYPNINAWLTRVAQVPGFISMKA
jgi:glutathione S-transferase